MNGDLRQFFYKTLIVISTLIGIYLLFEVRSILLLFFGAVLFASTIRPAVVTLQERRVPPLISILVIYLGSLLGIAGIISILFPTFLLSLQDLLKSQTSIFSALDQALQRIEFFASNGAGFQLPLPTVADLQNQLTQIQGSVQSNFDAYLLDGFRAVSEAVILFVLAFYWLTERDRFEEIGTRMVPLRHRERFISIVNEIELTLGAFVRGQTALCLTVGVMAFVALSILGVRSALVLATFAAVTEAIPFIGPILGAIPALLVALTQSPEQALFVGIAYLIIQQLESQLLVPKIMEHQVGLSPLFVLLALTAGNLLGGIVGAVVAIPIAAALSILVRELVIHPTVEANKLPVVEGAVLFTEPGSEELATEPEPVVAVSTTQSVPPAK